VSDPAGRNILPFPKGTKGTGDAVSVFLNVPELEKLPRDWDRKQAFKITIIDQLNLSKSVVRGEGSNPRGNTCRCYEREMAEARLAVHLA
jgi:hypothetical protein